MTDQKELRRKVNQERFEKALSFVIMLSNMNSNLDFMPALRDGRILCTAINKIRPGLVPRIETSSLKSRTRLNVSAFLKACRALGMSQDQLFMVDELWDEEHENKNMVKDAIFNLASFVMEMDTYNGPYLLWTEQGADLVEMFGQKDASVLDVPKCAVAMAR